MRPSCYNVPKIAGPSETEFMGSKWEYRGVGGPASYDTGELDVVSPVRRVPPYHESLDRTLCSYSLRVARLSAR